MCIPRPRMQDFERVAHLPELVEIDERGMVNTFFQRGDDVI